MTKDIIESKLLYFLQRKIGVYNEDNKLLKSGKLTLLNIREYTIQLVFNKPGGSFNYEIPYPFNVEQYKNQIKLDYKLSVLSKNDELLKYKFVIHTPPKKNKFYNTCITIKEL